MRTAVRTILVAGGLLWALAGTRADAQEPAEVPRAEATAPQKRPGLIRLGGLYLDPFFQVPAIGYETNVYLDAEETINDYFVDLRPGVRLIAPFSSDTRLTFSGWANEVYYVNEASQRRTTGGGSGRFERTSPGLALVMESAYDKTYRRPDSEIEKRIVESRWQNSIGARFFGGPRRFSLDTRAEWIRTLPDEGQSYQGVDLAKNLSYDRSRLVLGPRLGLTAKTAFVVEGDLRVDRFPRTPSRNLNSAAVYAGFEVASRTRLAGHLLAGVRWVRPAHAGDFDSFSTPYVDADVIWNLGVRSRLSAFYVRDFSYTFATVDGGPPTLSGDRYGGTALWGLPAQFDLLLFGWATGARTDGEVVTVDAQGVAHRARRSEEAYEVGGDLGVTIRRSVRVGVNVSYSRRDRGQREVPAFGVDGLRVGLSLNLNGLGTSMSVGSSGAKVIYRP